MITHKPTERLYRTGDLEPAPTDTPDAILFLQRLYEDIDDVPLIASGIRAEIRQYLQDVGAW